MNTLKPMATVVLLAGIGIVLYFKINQTPPVLPEGAQDEFLEAPTLDFLSEEAPSASTPASLATSGEPHSPTSLTEAPSFSAESGEAPAWTPPAATPSFPSAAADVEPALDATNAAATTPTAATTPPTVPPLPEIPIPPAATTVDRAGVTNQAAATSPPQQPPVSPTADPNLSAPAFPPAADAGSPSTSVSSAASEPPPTPPAGLSGPVASTPSAPPPSTPTARPGQVIPPINTTPVSSSPSSFSVARILVDEALHRGEFSQALRLLTDYYDDPSLAPEELQHVESLLGQLAGTVIYSTDHNLEPPHIVQPGETLAAIATRYNVSPELLGKINGLDDPNAIPSGSQLKVVPGPFTGIVDLGRNELRLILDGRYAGRFPLAASVAASNVGTWTVRSKTPSPAAGGKLVLQSQSGGSSPLTIESQTAAVGPESVQLSSQDAVDVYDILTVGSKVVIRR